MAKTNKRKHISWKTKCAAALVEVDWLRSLIQGQRLVPYDHAKEMTTTQYHSLWHWDHNKLHSFGGGDHFTNLTPEPIKAHREKTKQDMKTIAKSRRIRAWNEKTFSDSAGAGNGADDALARLGPAPPLRIGPDEESGENFRRPSIRSSSGPHKLRSRGFDKTRRRKMDGTVVKR